MAKIFEGPVYLEPIEHVYWHKTTGEKYTSVTTVLSALEHEFEEDKIAEAISKQREDRRKEAYKGLNKAQIIELWRHINFEATEYGTMVHEILERYLLADKFYFPNDELEKKVIAAYDAVGFDEGDVLWPERIMFSEKYALAGTADMIVDVQDEYFDVGDWKTNKKLDFYSPYRKFMKPPLQNVSQCNFNLYTIQLSIYAYMYEEETGKKLRQIWIGHWDREKEEIAKIPVFYARELAIKVLNWHKLRVSL